MPISERRLVEATSLTELLGLDGRQGHLLTLRAEGPAARAALTEFVAFLRRLRRSDLRNRRRVPGIAIGPLIHFRASESPISYAPAAAPEVEECRFRDALAAAQDALTAGLGASPRG